MKKEDLPGVWRDLDMPSGHAYAKALRTVKTCVGSEWCRFGVQDSTNMGIDLEKDLWRMYAPHKVKLAVSGCPRNCAEATIKDVGVIGVESGWEIYVAGNGGIKTEVAQFLCKLKTREEVLEYAGAFLQLYREEARYLDRTVHYVARVGLDYVKSDVVEDAEKRKALYARLRFALQGEPDPWRERAAARKRANSNCWRPERMSAVMKAASRRELDAQSAQIWTRNPATRRARGQERARQHRRVPQRRRRGVCAARQMPAQGRAAVAGHRVRPQGRVPAA